MSKGTSEKKLTRTEVARVSRMRSLLKDRGSKNDPRLTHPRTLDRLLRVIKE